jgi:hypothetical protein
MNKLLPISIVILLIILAVAFSMRKNCVCVNGQCSKCSGFGVDHFFKKKETFTSMASETPGFYKIQTIFPKLTEKTKMTTMRRKYTDYWL